MAFPVTEVAGNLSICLRDQSLMESETFNYILSKSCFPGKWHLGVYLVVGALKTSDLRLRTSKVVNVTGRCFFTLLTGSYNCTSSIFLKSFINPQKVLQ